MPARAESWRRTAAASSTDRHVILRDFLYLSIGVFAVVCGSQVGVGDIQWRATPPSSMEGRMVATIATDASLGWLAGFALEEACDT